MNGTKGVGPKPVSPPSVESTPAEQPKETMSTAQQDSAVQQLSKEGKAAKASESNIAGEAMRQALQGALADTASSALASGGAQVAQKGVAAAAQAAAAAAMKAASQPKQIMAASGVPYKPEARVPDNTPIFTDGKIDRDKVLQSLSQHDQSAKTKEDKDRCGGTAAIASAINNGGDKGLLKLTGAMKQNLPASNSKELTDIENRIKNKSATHGDLARLSELIHKGFALPDPKGGTGILDGDMHSLYSQSGLKPPKGAGLPEKIFQNGQSWPVNLDTDGDGSPNHWVVAGKDEKGRTFIYDPESTPGKPQIHYKGSSEYDNYIQQMKKTNSGFAPMTQAAADEARTKYEESL